MNHPTMIRLLNSEVGRLTCLALAIETHTRMDCRVIRDGEIVPAPPDLQMQRAHQLRESASIIKAVVNAMERAGEATGGASPGALSAPAEPARLTGENAKYGEATRQMVREWMAGDLAANEGIANGEPASIYHTRPK